MVFGFFIFGVSIMLSTLPSGGRFLNIAFYLSLVLLLIVYQNDYVKKWMKAPSYVVIPALLLFIFVSVRTSLYSVSITTILGNPLFAALFEDNYSINDILKN